MEKIAFIIGACLACLLPLIAKIYAKFIFATEGSALVAYCLYLWKRPLIGLTFINICLLLYAHRGWARANREKLKAWRKWMLNKLREP